MKPFIEHASTKPPTAQITISDGLAGQTERSAAERRAARDKDYDRLVAGWKELRWLKSLPPERREAEVGLMNDLLMVIEHARLTTPSMLPSCMKIKERQRKPGAGRKPDIRRATLLAGVRAALLSAGFKESRWIIDTDFASPLYETARLCWKIATGKKITDMRRGLGWKVGPTAELTADVARWHFGHLTPLELRRLPPRVQRLLFRA